MSRLKLKRCRELIALGCLWFAAAVLAGCASDGNIAAGTAGGTRATVCKSGDQPVASASQCLQDDAACYTLADGSFCTGPRGNTCPTGSTPMAAGADCPQGMRCFSVSESLSCSVGY